MLKLFSTVILFSVLVNTAQSQDIKNKSKIEDYLGTERYENSIQNNQGLIKFLDCKIEKGYAIESFQSNKSNDFDEISSITYNKEVKGEIISVDEFLQHSHQENFNVLYYDFPMPENGENGYFLLSGTNKVITIYSSKYLINHILVK